MRNKKPWIIMGTLLLVFLTGCGNKKNTFASITDNEMFQNVPIMTGEKLEFSEVEDVGAENFIITASNTTLTEYETYLTVLENDGYKKHVDNGEEGIEGYIYTSHYQKEDSLVVVCHMSKMQQTTINVCKNATLSEHLFYNQEEVAANNKDAKTSLTMPELYRAGQSFVIQLKNGHFIINDGGMEADLPYLLDYMDSLTPNGEKPIVDAWIVSHAHSDHMGAFITFMKKPEYLERVYVEEVYFTEASAAAQASEVGQYDHTDVLCFYVDTVPETMKSTDGTPPKMIRLRIGEKYYFNDIRIDVIFTADILPYTEWKTWNASSVVLMYTIEEQKMMLGADMDWECQKILLETFDDEYFDMKIYQAPHHGGNIYNEFSSHIKTDTILYPTYDVERNSKLTLLSRFVQNEYLKGIADEALGWRHGGIFLTFPYEVGTYQVLPLIDWIYNDTDPTNR